ncbi:MAG: hypothetical protein CFE24_14095 [Flavobacterium sp. BFFFF2]|nr:MAG: hypothetical protein CFE24_14095 [Flavobacterium sp. BFFFF2]
MNVVTLLTDFGSKDYFVGALKGLLIQQVPQCTIIDLSHEVDPFNVLEAAYILRSAYQSFPTNSIHIIGLDAEWCAQNQPMYAHYDGHHFLAADNGLFSLVFPNISMSNCYSLAQWTLSDQNKGMRTLVKAASFISENIALNEWCQPAASIKQLSELMSNIMDDRVIKGHVIYIDHYGNVVTSITLAQFESLHNGRAYSIEFRNQKLARLVQKYSEVATNVKFPLKNYEGEKLAIFNEAGYLEIALFRSNPNTLGSAHSLLGLNYRDTVYIRFTDN